MGDDLGPVGLERHLAEVLIEQALLWRLVALAQRAGDGLRREDVDAVLAGAHGHGPARLRRGGRDVLGRRRPRPDDVRRRP